jgi:NADPH:quinone reductase-like Zn-dependent oxidoreductase
MLYAPDGIGSTIDQTKREGPQPIKEQRTMKTYHLEHLGDLDGLVMRDQEVPTPGPHEVLVRIYATSLNRRDLRILNRSYPLPSRPGVIPISDGAGEVVAVGAQVTRAAVGDRVAGSYFARWKEGKITGDQMTQQLGCTLDGMLTEYALLDEEALVQIPAYLSFEEAATLPCAALTAWSALSGPEPIQSSDTVLTLGTGGVALFAVQLAKALGARVIATTSSDEKAERLKRLGADEVVNYRTTPEWSRAVHELTDGVGVQRVVETGGSDTLEESIRSVAPNGEIALVAAVGKRPLIEIHPSVLAASLLTIRRVLVGSRTLFEEMLPTLAKNELHPVIDRVFAFSEVRQAYQYYTTGHIFGKVVIQGAEISVMEH